MKILFVCKHNRFRSKVAEALFRKHNNGRDEVKSAGVRIDLTRPFVAFNVKKVLLKRGVRILDEKAREVNDFDLEWADRIIIVADNVPPGLFRDYGKEIDVWDVEDADESEERKIEGIVRDIDYRVKQLVMGLRDERKKSKRVKHL